MRAALALVLLAATLLPTVQADWGSFHNDEHNSGFIPGSEYQVYKERWWTLKLPTQVDASPVVDSTASIVVIVTWDHKIHAVDEESGSELWNATMAAKISSTPVIDNGRLFVVDNSGVLNAYNVQKGTPLGTVNVGNTLGSITVHEGKLFIGNEKGEMKAFDTDTLTLLWNFLDGGPGSGLYYDPPKSGGTGQGTICDTDRQIPAGQIRGAPAVAYGKVYFGSLNHFVYAVDEFGNPEKTSDPQWVYQTGDAIFASPLVTHGHVFVGSYDEHFYSLEAEPDSEGPLYSAPTTGTPQLCSTLIVTDPEWDYCVPPPSSGGGDSKVHSTAAVDGTESDIISRVIFGSNNGDVTALDPENGAGTTGFTDCSDPDHSTQTPLWTFHTRGAVKSSPAVANGHVVVGSDDGHVYWLSSATGGVGDNHAAEAEFKPTGTAPIKANPAIDGQRAFVVSFEGDIYMFGPTVPPRPDLQVSLPTYANGAISFTVTNAGTAPSGTFVVRVLVDGALLSDIAAPPLAAKNSTVLVAPAASIVVGAHQVRLIADNNNEVKESDEFHNTSSGSITVAPPAPPPPPVETTTTKKKAPEAGLLVVGVLGLMALAMRRRVR